MSVPPTNAPEPDWLKTSARRHARMIFQTLEGSEGPGDGLGLLLDRGIVLLVIRSNSLSSLLREPEDRWRWMRIAEERLVKLLKSGGHS